MLDVDSSCIFCCKIGDSKGNIFGVGFFVIVVGGKVGRIGVMRVEGLGVGMVVVIVLLVLMEGVLVSIIVEK